jgi:alpha-1,6-mannosyltransferase
MYLKQFLHSKQSALILFIIGITLYLNFGYDIVRDQFYPLLAIYSFLFGSFLVLIKSSILSIKQLTYIAFSYRALFILAIPNLSQDFYRFIWDGCLILEGINPYQYTPDAIMSWSTTPIPEATALHNGMGYLSAMHFSNYPPLNQFLFYLAALVSSKSILGSVVVLRLFIIAADFGTMHYGKKLLEKLNLNPKAIFWYILNPFIIIELTGNLHFEGVMVFFLISSLYCLVTHKWILSAILIGASISIKLIPLLFLPLYFWWFLKTKKNPNCEVSTSLDQTSKLSQLKIRSSKSVLLKNFTKLAGFYCMALLVVVVSFLPFLSQELINNYAKTIGLWFGNFEFNASIFNILKYIGYKINSSNNIKLISKGITVLVILVVLVLSFFRKNHQPKTLITSFLFALSVHVFTATTIHPWYLTTLLILSVFTNYKYIVVWSFTIFLSYYTYTQPDFKESYVLLGLQYLPVYLILFWDLFFNKKSFVKI